MSWHPVGPMRKRQTLARTGGAVHGLECFMCRMTVVGFITYPWDGPTRCRPAGVESGSGPKQPDGPGRMRESIPSCIPTISSPGSISTESPKIKSCSTAIPIVDGW